MSQKPEQMILRLMRLALEFWTDRPKDAEAILAGASAIKASVDTGILTADDFARLLQNKIPKQDLG